MNTVQFTKRASAILGWLLYLTLFCWSPSHAGDINPVLVGSWPGVRSASASDVALSGNYAYVSGGHSLLIIDVAAPSGPRPIGECALGGYGRRVDVVADHAYLVYENWPPPNGLKVVNVSNPSCPRQVGEYETDGQASDVVVSGNFAYLTICDGYSITNSLSGALEVLDVSNPANPQRVGRVSITGARRVTASGNRVFVGQGWWDESHTDLYRLSVIDVSNPTNPQVLGGLSIAGVIGEVVVRGDTAYLATGGGFEIVDISIPANPQRIASLTNIIGSGLTVFGDYAYATGDYWDGQRWVEALSVIDISMQTNPVPVGRFELNASFGHLGAVAVFNNQCCAISRDHSDWWGTGEGLLVFDISDPRSPQRVGAYDTSWNYTCISLAASSGYAYVGDRWDGLQVIDISNASGPRRVGGEHYVTASSMAVSGGFAYVGGSWKEGDLWCSGLRVVDLANPLALLTVGRYTNDFLQIKDLVVSGKHALIAADGAPPLHVVDISDPAIPRKVGFLNDTCIGLAVAAVGSRAYLGAEWSESGTARFGLLVVDFSDPANPITAGRCELGGERVYDIALSGPIACIATLDGLSLVDVSNAAAPRLLSRICTNNDGGWLGRNSVVVSGSYAYVLGSHGYSTGDGGWAVDVVVVEISDPAHPKRLGSRDIWRDNWNYANALAVSPSGKQIYAIGETGLMVFEMSPFIKSISRDGENLKLLWEGFGPARLQRATRLTNPDWQDLIGSENTNSATLPIWSGSEFFRLVRP